MTLLLDIRHGHILLRVMRCNNEPFRMHVCSNHVLYIEKSIVDMHVPSVGDR